MGQLAVASRRRLCLMLRKTTILSVERDGEDGLIVTFSDGTLGAYVAEELLELRPVREPSDDLGRQSPAQTEGN